MEDCAVSIMNYYYIPGLPRVTCPRFAALQVVRIADSSQLRARILVCYPYISTPDAYFREFGIPEASLNFLQLRTERGRGVPAWCLLNVLRISSARIAYALLSGFLVSNSMSFTR